MLVASVLLVVAVVLATAILQPRGDDPGVGDAVAVLGRSTPDRLATAQAIMAKGGASALVVSAYPPDLDGQVPPPVCVTPQPYPVYCFNPVPATTQGEARSLRRLAAEHQWRSIQVVTFRPQMERARLLIGRCYSGELRVVDSGQEFNRVGNLVYQSGAFAKAVATPGC